MFDLKHLKYAFPAYTKRYIKQRKVCSKCKLKLGLWSFPTDASDRQLVSAPSEHRINGIPTHHRCSTCNVLSVSDSKKKHKVSRYEKEWIDIKRQYQCYAPELGFDPFDISLFSSTLIQEDLDKPNTSTINLGKYRFDIPTNFIMLFLHWKDNQIGYALAAWQRIAKQLVNWSPVQQEVANNITEKFVKHRLTHLARHRRNYIRKFQCVQCKIWKFTSIESTHPQLINWMMGYGQQSPRGASPYEFDKQPNKTRTGWYSKCNKCRGKLDPPLEETINLKYPPHHLAWHTNKSSNNLPLYYSHENFFKRVTPLPVDDTHLKEKIKPKPIKVSSSKEIKKVIDVDTVLKDLDDNNDSDFGWARN